MTNFNHQHSNVVEAGGTRAEDQQEFLLNKMAPFLVSFPRTGSHWLRVMLERYTDRPLHTRSFFPHNNTDYLLYHTHDDELKERPLNVIYLFRSPADVVFSQLSYLKEDHADKEMVTHWSKQYSCHLIHWLIRETFTQKKTIICYEELKSNPHSQLMKVCDHLEISYDADKWQGLLEKTDKTKIKTLTAHDQSAVDVSLSYESKRLQFYDRSGQIVEQVFLKECDDLGVDPEFIQKLEV